LKILRRVLLVLAVALGLGLVALAVLTVDILRYAEIRDPVPADAALILGAAVYGDQPSPVFVERIRHGVSLYQAGTVKALVMSGGLAEGDTLTEAEAARDWAVTQGVPETAILLEDQSRTTLQNITFSLPLLEQHGFEKILIVSDPLHMRRAMVMAHDAGVDALPSPTPTSRYIGWSSRLDFLGRELWFNIWYAIYRQ
jgi:uncharacterized SAM-binding protein YcdF (DUF218 family)